MRGILILFVIFSHDGNKLDGLRDGVAHEIYGEQNLQGEYASNLTRG